jgi:hypothetical protein
MRESKQRSSSQSHCIESLESRRMLAGNVTVVIGGLTTLTGDSRDNSVSIVFGVGGYTITGLNGTTVNKSPSVLVPATLNFRAEMGGGHDSIEVVDPTGTVLDLHMGGGDDIVNIHDGESRNILIEAGNGNDQVIISKETLPAALGAGVLIDTGSGNDLVRLKAFNVGGSLEVFTGGGDDIVELLSDAGVGVSATTTCTFDGGKQFDSILIELLTSVEDPTIVNFELAVA